MNLSQFAFHNKRIVLSVLIMLMIIGIVNYFILPAQEDPNITIREAKITTRYPGMPAERVELLITKTLEEALRKISELKDIKSVSTEGVSIIHVETRDVIDSLEQVWDKLRHEIARVRHKLPEGTREPEVNDNFGDVAVITAAITGSDAFDMSYIFEMAKHVRDRLYSSKGVKRIDLLGVQEERIFIDVSNVKLTQLGLSHDYLRKVLSTQNIIYPSGVIDVGGQNFVITLTGNFDSVDDIKELLIPIPNTEHTIALRDIANVTKGFVEPPKLSAFFNGKPAIIFAIAKYEKSNTLEFAPRIVEDIARLNTELPAGMHIDIATNQAIQVEKAVYGVTFNVLQTLLIVMGVVILFLGVRTGLIVGMIVPSVMLVTLAVMGFMDMALERMSLATLVIALGLLVDNGIVMAEDFKRRIEDGETRDTAMKNSGSTLAIPLLISSLTTILVFLPLMLADDVAGEYTRAISLVILISLLTSWLIALMVTPTLCHFFIKNTQIKSGSGLQYFVMSFFDAMNPLYERVLRYILTHRAYFMLSIGTIFIIAIIAMTYVPKKFFPDSDRSQILVHLDLPAGNSMYQTNNVLKRFFKHIDDKKLFPYVTSYAAYGGFGGPRFVLALSPVDQEPHKGFIVVNVKDSKYIDNTIFELQELFLEEFPDVMARVTKMFLGPSDSSKIEIQIQGPDADFLYAKADEVSKILQSVPGTIEVRHNWENRVIQLKVNIDEKRARRAGVTAQNIAFTLQSYFSGIDISEFRSGSNVFSIVGRAEDNERFDLNRIYSIGIFSEKYQSFVPLMQVADIVPFNSYARIARENLFRTITVEAKNIFMTAESMVPLIDEQLKDMADTLPPSYNIKYTGVITRSSEAQSSLMANLPLCLIIIVLLLIAQFNSFRRAGIILLTIPLMIIGAVLGLVVMNANIGFMESLGLYALAGIIINNAIVLVDRIDIDRSLGANAYEAIISASVRRLRPIVMTSVTTILGLLPLMIKVDPLFYGMASIIAFGLAVGTVLTLGVTPVLYSILFKINPN